MSELIKVSFRGHVYSESWKRNDKVAALVRSNNNSNFVDDLVNQVKEQQDALKESERDLYKYRFHSESKGTPFVGDCFGY